MNAITITYGGATETIQAAGFSNCRLRLNARSPSVLILDRAGDEPAGFPVIPYGGQITVQVAMGDGSTYFWQGKRRDFSGHAVPQAPATSYMFEDVLGAMGRTTFKHFWVMSNGAGGTVNKYFSRVNLFQDIHAGPDVAWVYLTADQQLRQIVEFAASECGLPVQCGDTDPVWNMPIIPARAISCVEAMQIVMKPMPDMVTKLDYSTTPPTLSFKARKNCAAVTLPYAGTDAHGRHHTSTPDIKPRPDLQVPAVVLEYQITGTVAGHSYNDAIVDTYPPGATGLEENAINAPVDLRGPSDTLLKGTLVTEAADPTTSDFWLKYKTDLDDPNVIDPTTSMPGVHVVNTTVNDGTQPDGIKILDDDGDPVSLTDYPNELDPESSPIAAWMTGVNSKPVTIRATIKYVKNFPTVPPTPIHKADSHVVETRITLTNAPVGSTNYSATGSTDSGDPVPVHLAYSMWCAINNVAVNYVGGAATPPLVVPAITDPDNFQWEGEHELAENNIYSIITPANVLNLSGGNPSWANMNAVIYSVEIDFFNGKTTIHFGPFKHLQTAQFVEMITAFRYRLVWDNPNLRNSGNAGSAGATDVGKVASKENTVHGIPQQNLHTTLAPNAGDATKTNLVQTDALTNGGQLLIQTIKSDGTVDTTKPQVQLSNNDLGGTRIAKWREVACCDSSGSPKTIYVPASSPE